MYPQIYLDGPGAELPGAGAAVVSLHKKLVDHFGSQHCLDRAYVAALEEIEEDDETGRQDRPLTPFEEAFKKYADAMHQQNGLCSESQFFFEQPF